MMKTALITGSYGGLGTCFAELHAKTGGGLILVGRNERKLKEQASYLINSFSIPVNIILSDLSQTESADYIYHTCRKNNWQVDYLINNAGFGGQGDFARERALEEDVDMIRVNIDTLTRLCKLFLSDMVEKGTGRVLNVGSIASLIPGPLQAVYFASKAYVKSFSNALWQELRNTGVSVTCLMPGALHTGFAVRGGLSDTKLFTNNPPPLNAAKSGYEAMLKGKMNVVAGLPAIYRIFVPLLNIIPTKWTIHFVEKLQTPKIS